MEPTTYTDNIGKRIRMIFMDDPYPIPPNSLGTIVGVDSLNTYQIKWDSGRRLSVLPDEDKFEIFDPE